MSKVGDVVVIAARSHPHYGEAGVIEKPAAGSAHRLGFDWVVKLNGAYTGSCFVTEYEIHRV